MIVRRAFPFGMAAALLAAMPSVALSIDPEPGPEPEPRGPEPARPYRHRRSSKYMPHQGKRERERARRNHERRLAGGES